MKEFFVDNFLFNKNAPLIFTQFYFWVFFAFVMAIYSIIYEKKKPRNAFLFLVSVFFYYKTSGVFVCLLLFSTIIDFYIGGQIYKSTLQFKRRLFIALSVGINLIILSYFKYTTFYIESINYLFGLQIQPVDLIAKWSNQFIGTHFSIDKIILPIGISFYTFQTISYSIDIYRKKLKPVDNLIDFGFYVSFFPQLVAGPIVRASEFIPQIYEKYKVTREEFGMALFLILNGLMKKMFISDYIAVNFIDRVFSNPQTYGGLENVMAIFGYSIQVYSDFSGYTDIAIGVALMMGFRLPLNFNSPYKALHPGEFWKRWHISLSTWLKNYLYIPLGGNKKGEGRTNINLMLTMLIGGLWHGASWQFVIWGGLNGVGIVVYKYWKKISPFTDDSSWLIRFYSIFLTFTFITITRIYFRANSMETANAIMYQITNAFDLSQIGEILYAYKRILAVMAFALIIHWLPSNAKERYRQFFIAMPHWSKVFVVIITVFLIYQVKSSEIQPFIYFQF